MNDGVSNGHEGIHETDVTLPLRQLTNGEIPVEDWPGLRIFRIHPVQPQMIKLVCMLEQEEVENQRTKTKLSGLGQLPKLVPDGKRQETWNIQCNPVLSRKPQESNAYPGNVFRGPFSQEAGNEGRTGRTSSLNRLNGKGSTGGRAVA